MRALLVSTEWHGSHVRLSQAAQPPLLDVPKALAHVSRLLFMLP